jgi:hypothetical protein
MMMKNTKPRVKIRGLFVWVGIDLKVIFNPQSGLRRHNEY